MNTNTSAPTGVVSSKELGLESQPWQAFDYANPPDDGVMWVAVSSPETDCDVDDYGRTVGWHTGETEHSVCMVLLMSDGEGRIEFHELNDWELGRVPADGVVTHFAPLKRPRHPKA
jgi:hypothetical protein